MSTRYWARVVFVAMHRAETPGRSIAQDVTESPRRPCSLAQRVTERTVQWRHTMLVVLLGLVTCL